MSEKRFKYKVTDGFFDGDRLISIKEVVDLLNELVTKCHSLEKENEQLKSLVNACEYGQKSLMEEMKNNDEALDKIWEIMKELYGVIDDE